MIPKGWQRGMRTLAWLLAAAPAWASGWIINLSQATLDLKVTTLSLDSCILKAQHHASGKTPKTATMTVVVESPKGETKQFLNEGPEPRVLPGEVTFTPASEEKHAPLFTLKPGESLHMFGVRPDEVKAGDRNLITFGVFSRPFPLAREADLRPENLECTYYFGTDRAGSEETVIVGRQLKPLDAEGKPTAPSFVFQKKEAWESDVVILDAPASGPCCAIQ